MTGTTEFEREAAVLETDYSSAIALIGMAGRFPGATGPTELWRNVLSGAIELRELTDEQLRAAGVGPDLRADPRYVPVGVTLADIDRFDAAAFGFSPREAETMDPQHRLFLECAWEALESAGYCPTEAPGQVGVFAGCGFPDYLLHNVAQVATEPGGALLLAVGNERDSLASLVSYKLGLRGPAIGVQTFCSTSLVSVHLAGQSLLTYECDIALAGGAYLPVPQSTGYRYEPGGITAPDGVVRSFDAEASGTVMGAGVGVVALKRMTDALADGDVIHAVILGSAVNNDGRVRAGYTAPGVDGQAEVIETALSVAGVKAEDIDYVECHATGTVLGDAIELASMSRVFSTARDRPCVLGTAKPSIGHLDRASGVTGLIRAALALRNEVLPPTPNYRVPNPALALDRFTVLAQPQPWPTDGRPRRAGVSSFGIGGTNVHLVLEQAPPRPADPAPPGPQLLTFAAADDEALATLTERLRQHLTDNHTDDLAEVAYTLQTSRGGFALRRAVVCQDRADAIAALADPTRWRTGRVRRRDPLVRLVSADGAPVRDARWAALGVRIAGVEATDGVEEIAVPRAGAPWPSILDAVASLWLAGCPINWTKLARRTPRRVELPTYPFQRRRYWIDPAPGPVDRPTAPTNAGRTSDRARWTYLPTWQRGSCSVVDLDERLRLAGPWLVLVADERGAALIDQLTGAGAEVVAVRPGAAFEQDDTGDFRVRVDSADDLTETLAALLVAPRAIVHGFSLASRPAGPADDPLVHFTAEQARGFHSAIALATALARTGVAHPVNLVLLTGGATEVVGIDLRHPEHAAIAAVGPSLSQENPWLRCRHIDADAPATGHAVALGRLARQILAASVGPHQGPVAIRGDETWLRGYAPFPTEEISEANRPLARGDRVLITDGLGAVGRVLATALAAEYGCRLVLTGCAELPARGDWPSALAAGTGDERIARQIRDILDLEAANAQVLAVPADVTDETAMHAVVAEATDRFGGIDVVVHAAAVRDQGGLDLAHLLDRTAADRHFAAKVGGFHVLRKVLAGQQSWRGLNVSSLAAVLGGVTLAPYAAASAALDAYSQAARHSCDEQWITVDWDAWQFGADRPDGPGATYAMDPAEGADLFARCLAAGDRVGYLVVSTGPLEPRIAQWVTPDPVERTDHPRADRDRHPRPNLDTPYVAPNDGTEALLAEVWSRVLGIEPIGANDDFFDLDGDSLLAIELVDQIGKALGRQPHTTAVLESPTVRQLAKLIDQGGSADEPETW